MIKNLFKRFLPALLLLLSCMLAAGCSVRSMAINSLGDALSSGGTSFASDDDPELVKAAAPFSLKLIESLLAESPRHRGLLLAAASGFTQYAYAFIQQEADVLEEQDFEAAADLRARARRLYLRARDYGLRGIEINHAGFGKELRENSRSAVSMMRREDVPYLYWTAVSWAAAVSVSKNEPDLVADLPFIDALINRALELNEAFDSGAIHAFLISYQSGGKSENSDIGAHSRIHFDRAMTLSKGNLAGPLVAFAESVSLGNQDRTEFVSLLEQALAIDIDARPEWRLANCIMQRRAQWLLSRTSKLFYSSD